jgi:hypothetical protein
MAITAWLGYWKNDTRTHAYRQRGDLMVVRSEFPAPAGGDLNEFVWIKQLLDGANTLDEARDLYGPFHMTWPQFRATDPERPALATQTPVNATKVTQERAKWEADKAELEGR